MKNKKTVLGICLALSLLSCGFAVGTSFPSSAEQNQTGEDGFFSSENQLSVSYDTSDTRGVKGATVSLCGIEGQKRASFKYENFIKKEELGSGFLELSMAPSAPNVQEIDYLLVTLTDAVDDSQKLVYALAPQPETCGWWNHWTSAWVGYTDRVEPTTSIKYTYNAMLKIEGTEQRFVGYNNSFINQYQDEYKKSKYLSPGYNFGAKSAYFVPETEDAVLNSMTFALKGSLATVNNTTIVDLSNADYIASASENLLNTEYEGLYTTERYDELFSSGYCDLEISYIGVNVDSVSCHIKKIGKQTLGSNGVDKTTPFFDVQTTTNAVKNIEFAFPNVKIIDKREGDISSKAVYSFFDKNGNDLPVSGNGIVFDREGEYTMRCQVTLSDGKVFYVDNKVVCLAKMPKTVFDGDCDFLPSYKTGDRIVIPKINAYNDLSLTDDKEVAVNVVVQANGSTKAVLSGKEYNYFTLESAGQYVVAYVFNNAYNISDVKSYSFSVEESIGFIPEFLPVSLTSKANNKIGDVKLQNFVNATEENRIYRAVYVNDEQIFLAQGKTVFSGGLLFDKTLDGETATITYKAGFDKDNLIYAKEFTIPVLSPKYAEDYIIATVNGELDRNAFTLKQANNELILSSSENVVYTLPQCVFSDGLELTFDVKSASAEYQALNVILTDYIDRDKKIEFSVQPYDAITSKLYVNGTYSGFIGGSLTNDQNFFEWRYDGANARLVDFVGNGITSRIKTWSDGSAFNGFTNGAAVVSFAVQGAKGEVDFSLKKVNNQPFFTSVVSGKKQAFSDIYAPVVAIERAVERQVAYGGSIFVPSAKSFDVLQPFGTLIVSVEDPNGNEVFRGNGESALAIPANSFGNWTVCYISYDKNEMLAVEEKYVVKVVDSTPPEIYLSGKIEGKAALNTEYRFPVPQVFDNGTQNCKAYIIMIEPNGHRTVLPDGKYVFKQKGIYTLQYYAFDDYMNISERNYTVIAE